MAEKPHKVPFYQDVDGFRIPGIFSADAFRSALKYKPTPEDLFVVTYPKCGTTWAQQILYLIYNKGKPTENPMEFWSRMPFIEMLGVESAEGMLRPGAIKSHLPYSLVPRSDDAKYLYVVRNPKDTLVSFFHHTRGPMYKFEDGNFDDFFELFINGETDFGGYFEHVRGWYEHRKEPNVMFLTYEEMKQDPKAGVLKIAKFLGDDYEELLKKDDDVLANILKYSSVEYMKSVFNVTMEEIIEKMKVLGVDITSQPMFPGMEHIIKASAELKQDPGQKSQFIRKGIVGDWRNALSADQARRIDQMIEEKMKDTELYEYWKKIDCV